MVLSLMKTDFIRIAAPADAAKITSVIKLAWLAVKLFQELPELAVIGGNLTELGGCLAGFVTADSR